MTGMFERGTQSWRYVVAHRTEAIRHAQVVTAIGCLLVAGATALQLFLTLAHSAPSPPAFWATLAAEIAGFALIFRGLWEWGRLHRRSERPHRFRWFVLLLLANAVVFGGVGFQQKFRRIRERYLLRWALVMSSAGTLFVVATQRLENAARLRRPWKLPRRGFMLFGGGVLGTAVLDLALGEVSAGPTPFPVVWLVGGLVVLLFVGFFQRIRLAAGSVDAGLVRILCWAAIVWGFGASVFSGVVIGQISFPLLVNFFTDWVALGPLAATVVLSLSPLFVAYALLGAALVLAAAPIGAGGTAARGASAPSRSVPGVENPSSSPVQVRTRTVD